jgi:hypothetical protein
MHANFFRWKHKKLKRLSHTNFSTHTKIPFYKICQLQKKSETNFPLFRPSKQFISHNHLQFYYNNRYYANDGCCLVRENKKSSTFFVNKKLFFHFKKQPIKTYCRYYCFGSLFCPTPGTVCTDYADQYALMGYISTCATNLNGVVPAPYSYPPPASAGNPAAAMTAVSTLGWAG